MSITWNGVSSDTIGVIVERIPNRYVPTRRFSPQQVAGRNGNILLVDKAFPNVEQEYEVYLSAESQGLPSVARACAEWLMGPDGYCRLTDSYDTTVYREAFLMGGFDIENILNKFGRCTITFSCKPQKYLLTGDTPIEIPDGTTTTYTGDVVQFDVITGASITSLSTTITPTQDLHGYDHPWPAGGGKNLLPEKKYQYTSTQVRIGTDGTAGTIYNIHLKSGTYTLAVTANVSVTTHCKAYFPDTGTYGNAINIGTGGGTFTITDEALYNFYCYKSGGLSVDDVTKWQLEDGNEATSWVPFENLLARLPLDLFFRLHKCAFFVNINICCLFVCIITF